MNSFVNHHHHNTMSEGKGKEKVDDGLPSADVTETIDLARALWADEVPAQFRFLIYENAETNTKYTEIQTLEDLPRIALDYVSEAEYDVNPNSILYGSLMMYAIAARFLAETGPVRDLHLGTALRLLYLNNMKLPTPAIKDALVPPGMTVPPDNPILNRFLSGLFLYGGESTYMYKLVEEDVRQNEEGPAVGKLTCLCVQALLFSFLEELRARNREHNFAEPLTSMPAKWVAYFYLVVHKIAVCNPEGVGAENMKLGENLGERLSGTLFWRVFTNEGTAPAEVRSYTASQFFDLVFPKAQLPEGENWFDELRYKEYKIEVLQSWWQKFKDIQSGVVHVQAGPPDPPPPEEVVDPTVPLETKDSSTIEYPDIDGQLMEDDDSQKTLTRSEEDSEKTKSPSWDGITTIPIAPAATSGGAVLVPLDTTPGDTTPAPPPIVGPPPKPAPVVGPTSKPAPSSGPAAKPGPTTAPPPTPKPGPTSAPPPPSNSAPGPTTAPPPTPKPSPTTAPPPTPKPGPTTAPPSTPKPTTTAPPPTSTPGPTTAPKPTTPKPTTTAPPPTPKPGPTTAPPTTPKPGPTTTPPPPPKPPADDPMATSPFTPPHTGPKPAPSHTGPKPAPPFTGPKPAPPNLTPALDAVPKILDEQAQLREQLAEVLRRQEIQHKEELDLKHRFTEFKAQWDHHRAAPPPPLPDYNPKLDEIQANLQVVRNGLVESTAILTQQHKELHDSIAQVRALLPPDLVGGLAEMANRLNNLQAEMTKVQVDLRAAFQIQGLASDEIRLTTGQFGPDLQQVRNAVQDIARVTAAPTALVGEQLTKILERLNATANTRDADLQRILAALERLQTAPPPTTTTPPPILGATTVNNDHIQELRGALRNVMQKLRDVEQEIRRIPPPPTVAPAPAPPFTPALTPAPAPTPTQTPTRAPQDCVTREDLRDAVREMLASVHHNITPPANGPVVVVSGGPCPPTTYPPPFDGYGQPEIPPLIPVKYEYNPPVPARWSQYPVSTGAPPPPPPIPHLPPVVVPLDEDGDSPWEWIDAVPATTPHQPPRLVDKPVQNVPIEGSPLTGTGVSFPTAPVQAPTTTTPTQTPPIQATTTTIPTQTPPVPALPQPPTTTTTTSDSGPFFPPRPVWDFSRYPPPVYQNTRAPTEDSSKLYCGGQLLTTPPPGRVFGSRQQCFRKGLGRGLN
jgi:hypothetical protein